MGGGSQARRRHRIQPVLLHLPIQGALGVLPACTSCFLLPFFGCGMLGRYLCTTCALFL